VESRIRSLTPGTLIDLAYSKITTSHVASEIQGEEGTMAIDQITLAAIAAP
jgi:hypothetical protein